MIPTQETSAMTTHTAAAESSPQERTYDVEVRAEVTDIHVYQMRVTARSQAEAEAQVRAATLQQGAGAFELQDPRLEDGEPDWEDAEITARETGAEREG